MVTRLDEEKLADRFTGLDRKRQGLFFTPAPWVQQVLAEAARHLDPTRPLSVIDPACGAGAFLAEAKERFPAAELFGLELTAQVARYCKRRLPRANVLTGDAFGTGFPRLCARIPKGTFELWVGNPPFNGKSAVLKRPDAYRRLRALLPEHHRLPRGQSLRDDFAFFLLLAAERLSSHPGLLAFVTPSTLLDSFLYGPLREYLLARLKLAAVFDLGAGVFADARVKVCVTFWHSQPRAAPGQRARYLLRKGDPAKPLLVPGGAVRAGPPDYLLRPPSPEALELDRQWNHDGEALCLLVPVSFSGLKTRFDELWVDPDRQHLEERVSDFFRSSPEELEAFLRRHALPPSSLPKLASLKARAETRRLRFRQDRVRAFFRYRGPYHRGSVPATAAEFCYLERDLIPRGDHRMQGRFDPHRCDFKLLFNVRELPLAAAILTRRGCVHDYRHSRFAPLFVPRKLLERTGSGLGHAFRLQRQAPNLSTRGLEAARCLGGPQSVFERVCEFINSDEVQKVWAPAFGATRDLPIPVLRWR